MNIFWEKRQFFELTTKKRSSEFLPGKSEIFPENRKFFSAGIDNFCDRIHDLQTSNQIDAAVPIRDNLTWDKSYK